MIKTLYLSTNILFPLNKTIPSHSLYLPISLIYIYIYIMINKKLATHSLYVPFNKTCIR